MKPRRSSSRRAKAARLRVKKLKTVERIKQGDSIPTIPSRFVGLTPDSRAFTERSEVAGVQLPTDLRTVVDSCAERCLQNVRTRLTTPPWRFCPEEWTQAERDEWRPMADEWDWKNLGFFLGDAFRQGFFLALLRYAEHLQHASEALQILNDQQENGQLLAVEGRRAKAEQDSERATLICDLWQRVRTSFPSGRPGNGQALRAVAGRYEAQTHRSIRSETVRNILKRHRIAFTK